MITQYNPTLLPATVTHSRDNTCPTHRDYITRSVSSIITRTPHRDFVTRHALASASCDTTTCEIFLLYSLYDRLSPTTTACATHKQWPQTTSHSCITATKTPYEAVIQPLRDAMSFHNSQTQQPAQRAQQSVRYVSTVADEPTSAETPNYLGTQYRLSFYRLLL